MPLTDAAMAALVPLLVLVLAAGFWRHSRKLAVGVTACLSLWLLLVAVLASRGVFAEETAPPRLLFVPASALLTVLIVGQTQTMRALAASTPRHWVVGLQSFRIAVELILFGLYSTGRASIQVTFETRNFDILVGLTAPALAWLLSRGRASRIAVIFWNWIGLGILLNTVVNVLGLLPPPAGAHWQGRPFPELVTWPFIWLPAFLVPLAVGLHNLSIQQAALARIPIASDSQPT